MANTEPTTETGSLRFESFLGHWSSVIGLSAVLLAALPICAQDARPLSPANLPDPTAGATTFRVMSYNLHNFLLIDRNNDGKEDDPKPEDEKQALYTIIAEESPDLLGIVEVGSTKFLTEIQDGLRGKGREYLYSEWIEGTDHSRHIALLSRYPIVARHPHTEESYDANGEKLCVSRGIIEADVRLSPSLTVKVFVAHLKSKRTAPGPFTADQMRVEEAKILRKCVNDALATDPHLNLVLMGDFNDTPGSPALQVVLNDTQFPLHNTHPKNAKGYQGTYYYRPTKKFETIDYLLVSNALSARLLPGSARIRDDKLAWTASDHFPVMADFNLGPAK